MMTARVSHPGQTRHQQAAIEQSALTGIQQLHPLRVAVCVDQRVGQGEEISGLARCWWEIAQIGGQVEGLDLTVHVLADKVDRQVMAPNVRIVSHTPRCGSRALARIRMLKTPTHVSLYPYHSELARQLEDVHVIHTTYTFLTFARTALRVSQRLHIPLVNSLHTDIPAYADIYSREVLKGWLGFSPRWVGRVVAGLIRLEALWYLRHCSHIFASTPMDRDRLAARFGNERVHLFSRGIDKDNFHPNRANRSRLRQKFGIRDDEFVLLLSGRVNQEKNPLLAARIVRRLRQDGLPVRLLVAGEGDMAQKVAQESRGGAVLAGAVTHEDLGWITASCDTLLFTSPTEMYANAVVEAMAAGLPVVISGNGGSRQHLIGDGSDGIIVPDDTVECWTEVMKQLLNNPERRRSMSETARRRIEEEYGNWLDVLKNQLLPVWQMAALEKSALK